MPRIEEHRTYTARFLSHALEALAMRTFRVQWDGNAVRIEVPCRTPEEARQVLEQMINTPYHVDRRAGAQEPPADRE